MFPGLRMSDFFNPQEIKRSGIIVVWPFASRLLGVTRFETRLVVPIALSTVTAAWWTLCVGAVRSTGPLGVRLQLREGIDSRYISLW